MSNNVGHSASPKTRQMSLAFDSERGESRSRPTDGRYADVSDIKASGSTYTPHGIATYLAKRLVEAATLAADAPITILDPAIGDGALALALLEALAQVRTSRLHLIGYETNPQAAELARRAISERFSSVKLDIRCSDFLADQTRDSFDLAIANPPYVRTQILGAEDARQLADRFGLEGRIDLYQAFALELIRRLKPGAALALITSNRFLTIKGAEAFRSALSAHLEIVRIWDLGDTKVFDAAVLPAMLVARKSPSPTSSVAQFTSIYESQRIEARSLDSIAAALDQSGDVGVGGRSFTVIQGQLHARPGEVWRPNTSELEQWLKTVASNTWRLISDLGKVRVGIKTTADKVFIRDDWADIGTELPELLRPLITHHVSARFRGEQPSKQVLYPHLVVDGKRQVADLSRFPRTAQYLESHRSTLEGRKYVAAAGRKWYEVWVPQDPSMWAIPKIVFRDIAEKPTFWLDDMGSVVNGDCYWWAAEQHPKSEVLWLALAIMNSAFIEAFYDRCFNNKLYAGRRRFMSQYVEKFPLPDPDSDNGRKLISLAKARYQSVAPAEQERIEREIDAAVWRAFGVRSL